MIDKNFNKQVEELIKKYWDYDSLFDYKSDGYKYRDVARYLNYWHRYFDEININKGDKIALSGSNSKNWALIYISAITYGLTIVPILSEFHAQDIKHILKHSEAKIFFCDDKIYQKTDPETVENLKIIISLNSFKLLEYTKNKYSKKYELISLKKISKNDFKLKNEISNDEIASLVYTSGTTGFSKGVLLPYKSLLANIDFANKNIGLKEKDNILSFLPLAHTYGCSFDFLFPFFIGSKIVFLSMIPAPKILLKAFSDVKPKLINMVPLLIEKIYKKKIKPKLNEFPVKILKKIPIVKNKVYKKIKKNLEKALGGNFIEVVIGGAPLNPEVEEFLKKIDLKFSVGYGMTECGPLISYEPSDSHKTASVGKVIDYLDVRIDSENPSEIVGEIQVKGVNVMNGYFKNHKATEEVFTKDAWLKTEDLGIIDKDNFIYIKGRSKNLILGPSGQNIYPEEIENKLNNTAFIEESLVYEKKDEIIALIYPDFDRVDEKHLNDLDPEKFLEDKMEENRKQINEILPSYSKIKQIKLHPEPFEKTPTRKIKRYLYKNY